MIRNIKIISGGQSGVDRAALDFALENQVPCGGWCPKGRLAEDGRIHKRYPLRETDNTDYRIRTKANVQDSDGTLIIYIDKLGNGTALTKQIAERLNKPCILISLDKAFAVKIEELHSWMEVNEIKTLNIAGPRESSNPGIYNVTLRFLEMAFWPSLL